MYGSGEFASHREEQTKDVGRGRLERVFAQSSNKRSEARRPFPKNSIIQKSALHGWLINGCWALMYDNVGKVYI